MPNKTIDALAFCPFYISEAKYTITCEGIISQTTTSKFKTEAEKIYHEENFCTARTCTGCGVFSALMNNYPPSTKCTVLRH